MLPLITTQALAEQMGAPDLRLLDASFYLPAESTNPAEIFTKAHIPGAQFFDIDAVADTESALPHMVPPVSRFEKLMAGLGISNSDRVVFYDQRGVFSSPRGWWLMRLFGHDQVAVLDGGLPKWVAEGRPVVSGPAAPAAPGAFRANLRTHLLRGIGDMLENVETQRELVLDARAAGRFAGTAPEPRAGLPSGHMPGARNLPWSDLVGPEKTLLPASDLRARFAAVGVDGSKKVVTSCGSGISACLLALGLHVAGLPDAAVYDGSWTEWALRPETPKVT